MDSEMKIVLFAFFSLTVVQCISLQSEEKSTPIFLKQLGDWDYYKINVTGVMTSLNVKNACENAGFVAPCPGPPGCQFSSKECNDTGLPNEAGQCSGWFDLCDNNPPQGCNELRGVYMYYHDWHDGAACGVVEGAYYPFKCMNGRYNLNKSALCAKQRKIKPLKEKLLIIESLLQDVLDDLD